MLRVQPALLPDRALLGRYRASGDFTDCYTTDTDGSVSIARFVAAFYTTPLFRLERVILSWALSRPSTDAGARQLAEGLAETFSAWRVEGRSDDQLLMTDVQGRTRSWFMVAPLTTGGDARTRLYFGSSVIKVVDPATGEAGVGPGFRALLGFHKLYSVLLLASARSRLAGQQPAG